MRKERLTSLVLLLAFLISILFFFVALSNLQLLIPVCIWMLMPWVGVILNRQGKTLAAGIVVIAVIECGLCSWLISLGYNGGGLSPVELPFINILIMPVLLAVSLFSPKVSLPLGGFNILFTVAVILFLPKTPELMHYLASPVWAMAIYFTPIINLLCTILLSCLWVSVAWSAMRQADQQEKWGQFAQDLINDPEFLTQTHDKLDSIRRRRNAQSEHWTYDSWRSPYY